jgi:hypothetical protein
MAKEPKVKRHLFAKTFLPIGWLGDEVQDLKSFNRRVITTIKSILTKPTPERQETFEQAMTRLGLTRKATLKIASRYRIFSALFFLGGAVLFVYAFYLLFAYQSFSGLIIGLAATAFCLTQAFRYNFWAYQIKVQRLGVTFKEWKKHLLNRTGISS